MVSLAPLGVRRVGVTVHEEESNSGGQLAVGAVGNGGSWQWGQLAVRAVGM